MIRPVKLAQHARGDQAAEDGRRTPPQCPADGDGNRGFLAELRSQPIATFEPVRLSSSRVL